MQKQLQELLDACPSCNAYFNSNVPTILDDGGCLSDEQIEWVISKLKEYHEVGHDVH